MDHTMPPVPAFVEAPTSPPPAPQDAAATATRSHPGAFLTTALGTEIAVSQSRTDSPDGALPGQSLDSTQRWQILYEHMKQLPDGALVTWEEMAAMLSLDFESDRAIVSAAARRANKELQNDRLLCVVVRGLGYKRAAPQDRIVVAKKHQQKALRELDRAAHVVDIDVSQIEPNTAKALTVTGLALAHQVERVRELDIRGDMLERRIDMVTRVVAEGHSVLAARAEEHDVHLRDLQARVALLEQSTT